MHPQNPRLLRLRASPLLAPEIFEPWGEQRELPPEATAGAEVEVPAESQAGQEDLARKGDKREISSEDRLLRSGPGGQQHLLIRQEEELSGDKVPLEAEGGARANLGCRERERLPGSRGLQRQRRSERDNK